MKEEERKKGGGGVPLAESKRQSEYSLSSGQQGTGCTTVHFPLPEDTHGTCTYEYQRLPLTVQEVERRGRPYLLLFLLRVVSAHVVSSPSLLYVASVTSDEELERHASQTAAISLSNHVNGRHVIIMHSSELYTPRRSNAIILFSHA